ncbi:MAG: DUF368 domain-containing protein [Roseburia sp.]|nr:DUF368 domain-containing protein [Roseburia sp.]
MEFIKDIIRGIAIGVANIIPGVSGGTMMVSMGIYDEMIGAVTGVFRHLKQSIRTLLPYAVGMGIGIVGLSFVIGYFFEHYPFQTALLFIGLIFGGLPMLLPKVTGQRPKAAELLVFVLFFGLIIGMQFLGTGKEKVLSLEPGTLLGLFFIGLVAAATMVIPGVSGSMLLMALGYYTPIIDHINAFIVALVMLDMGTLFYCVGILLPFGIGVLVGAFLVAKLIEYLLKNHERMTYFAILGLLFSSPVAVLSGMDLSGTGVWAVVAGILLFGVGMVAASLLGKE